MQNKCPKCGKCIKSSKIKKSLKYVPSFGFLDAQKLESSKISDKTKNKDINFLSLNLLFGVVSLKKNKKGTCDLCGAKMKRK